jgi:hypothetical protein
VSDDGKHRARPSYIRVAQLGSNGVALFRVAEIVDMEISL